MTDSATAPFDETSRQHAQDSRRVAAAVLQAVRADQSPDRVFLRANAALGFAKAGARGLRAAA